MLVKQLILSRDVANRSKFETIGTLRFKPDADVVGDHHFVDGLRRMCHEHTRFELRLPHIRCFDAKWTEAYFLEEIRDGGGVVKVKTERSQPYDMGHKAH